MFITNIQIKTIKTMMKKNILFIISAAFIAASFVACQPKQPTSYTIHGEIAGDANGKQVFLFPIVGEVAMDSTTIEDNKFSFTGTMDAPDRVRVVIDANPEDKKGNKRGFKQSYFYLENGDIQYIAHIDSMPSLFYNPNVKSVSPVIKGSKSQDLHESYMTSVKELNTKFRSLDQEYLIEYHQPAMDGEFNVERGIELQKQINEVSAQLGKEKMNFIRANADSRVALDMGASYFQDIFSSLTVNEVDELLEILRPSWGGTEEFADLEEMAQHAKKIAIGSKYTDVNLLNKDGDSVKLSDYIHPDKYTLVEFWATWCGPCRAEIPHLKHVYEEFKDKNFDIINVSFDDNTEEWHKTLKEEGMTWTQLIDPQHFEGEAAKAYRIMGIPYSILLDPDGIIIGTDMRGAKLDLALQGKIE